MNYFLFAIALSSSLLSQSFFSFVQQLEQLPPSQRAETVEQYLSLKKTTPIIEQDSLLHFVYFGSAEAMVVNGNLQRWNFPDTMKKIVCVKKSFFYRSFTVPPDARLDYQFIVDGKYQIDSLNPLTTPSGFGPHSEVRMPKFISSPYLIYRDSIPHGKIDTVYLYKYLPSLLKRYMLPARIIKVYLPPGYDSLTALPSVFVHDGNDAMNFALLPTILDNLIANKKIQPIIAVFIPPTLREAEYREELRDKFVALLCNEIVPMIDRKYKTDSTKYRRAVMGASDGGHISLYTAFSRPDIFHKVGGQSSTITPLIRKLVQQRVNENIFSPKFKIYLDCGRYDIKSPNPIFGYHEFILMNRDFSKFLSSLRIPHYFREVNDGHEWASWRERIPEMLQYFFGK